MDGFLNFNKDVGIASNKALDLIKKATGQTKAGFLGTLDPIASGILPVALGWGTRLFPYFEKVPKRYRATILFGFETDTQDCTGTATVTAPTGHITREKLEEAIAHFTGEIDQVPPMYSAKKVDGQRLYRIARKGGEVERAPKKVVVHSLDLLEFSGDAAIITATVSQGTYIRTLCEDIGRRLGTAAHMGTLVRERVHVFGLEDSWTIERLEAAGDRPEEWLLPLDFPLATLPRHEMNAWEEKGLCNGRAVRFVGPMKGPVCLYAAGGRFCGIGNADPVTQKMNPEKMVPVGNPVRFSSR